MALGEHAVKILNGVFNIFEWILLRTFNMKIASWEFFIFVIACFDWFNICSPDIWNAVAEYGFRLLAAEFIAKTWPFWFIDSSFLAINILNKSNNLPSSSKRAFSNVFKISFSISSKLLSKHLEEMLKKRFPGASWSSVFNLNEALIPPVTLDWRAWISS